MGWHHDRALAFSSELSLQRFLARILNDQQDPIGVSRPPSRAKTPASLLSAVSSPSSNSAHISRANSVSGGSGAKRPSVPLMLFTSRASIASAPLLPAAITACGRSMITGPSSPTSPLNSDRSPRMSPRAAGVFMNPCARVRDLLSRHAV
jgi:hypothetical protein